MTEQYLGWALVVGVALGGLLVWLILGRLSRRTDDVGPEERAAEARWIGQIVEGRGGIAPAVLVEEVLALHDEYLAGPPLDVRARLARDIGRRRPAGGREVAHGPELAAGREPGAGSELAAEDRDPV